LPCEEPKYAPNGVVGPSHVDAPEGISNDVPFVVQVADGEPKPSVASDMVPVVPVRDHVAYSPVPPTACTEDTAMAAVREVARRLAGSRIARWRRMAVSLGNAPRPGRKVL